MNCDYLLLFKYMEGRTTPEETARAERMMEENGEFRENYQKLKPALDAMRPFWPKREICPNSWNLVQYLHGDLKDPDLIRSIEEHIERCRFCRAIKESYEAYQQIPDNEKAIRERDLSGKARKALDDLRKRYS